MTENDMKKLSRADLLEMLIDQSNELNKVKEKLNKAEAALKQKELYINNAGSIAEASLKLNGVFEAAQAASQQSMDHIKLSKKRTESWLKPRRSARLWRRKQKSAAPKWSPKPKRNPSIIGMNSLRSWMYTTRSIRACVNCFL